MEIKFHLLAAELIRCFGNRLWDQRPRPIRLGFCPRAELDQSPIPASKPVH